MAKNAKVKIFVDFIKQNFYFTDEGVFSANVYELDKDGEGVTIYNPNSTLVAGLGSIGMMAEALNLCCTAYWNEFDNRVEVRVH